MIKFKRENGKDYTLEFTRDSVRYAESRGFRIDEFEEKVLTNTENLFYFAFKAHHPEVTTEEAYKILYDEFGGLSSDEVRNLVEDYVETYTALINEESPKKSRKVTIL